MELRIYGASDDLVEIEGGLSGEIDVGSDPVCYVKVGDGERCTMVRMEYAPTFKAGGETVWADGCWVATVFPLAEGVPMHECSVAMNQIRGEPGYSADVVFDVPDGTPVVWRSGERGWENPS